MTVLEMAEKTLEERWIPIAEAESCEEMRKILEETWCEFCIRSGKRSGGRCFKCLLYINERCCDGHLRKWCEAIGDNDFPKAHDEALVIVAIIKKVRDEAKEN